MMFTVKAVGIFLVVLSSSYLGIYLSMREKKHIDLIYRLKKALQILKGEIEFALASFEESSINVSNRTEKPISDIFMAIAEGAASREFMSGEEIFTYAFDKHASGTYFDSEDRNMFISLGKTLGHLDTHMQSAGITIAMEYIDSKILALKEKESKSSRMYRSLGVLGGILVAVLLI